MKLSMSCPAGPTESRCDQASRDEFEFTERRRNVPRRIVADLVAIAAAIGLDEVEPLLLGLEVFRDAVALVAGSGEAALVRHADHRGPVNRRVVLRCRGQARRNHGGQIERLPRLRRHLLGIDQAIAAHPDPVAGFWQVGDDVAAALVGDDDLGEAGAEITGLGDDPDPGLRAKPAGDGPADRLVVNRDRRWVACFRPSRLLSARHTGGDEKLR